MMQNFDRAKTFHFAWIRRCTLAAATLSMSASVAIAAPEITSVGGCTDDAAGGTAECPTAGGILITIAGSNFGASGSAALVGSRLCIPTAAGDTEIICTLPSGSGSDVRVVVRDSFGNASLPADLLSYSPPEITSVSGCTADPGGSGSTTECAREGGQTLTINGHNFGPSGAAKTVLVGGEVCPTSDDTDEQLECTIPPGSGTGKRVLIVAANQFSVGTTYTMSYAQCPPGTTLGAGGACTSCPAGEFAPYHDNTECQSCPAGTWSSAGSADCTGSSSYQCWQAKDVSADKFTKIESFSVNDELTPTGTVEVKKLAMYCAAAVTDGSVEPPADLSQCCYQVKGTKLNPVKQTTTMDDIGEQRTIDVSQPKFVCASCDSTHF